MVGASCASGEAGFVLTKVHVHPLPTWIWLQPQGWEMVEENPEETLLTHPSLSFASNLEPRGLVHFQSPSHVSPLKKTWEGQGGASH